MYCNRDSFGNVAKILNDSEDEDIYDIVQLWASDAKDDDSGEWRMEAVENTYTATVDITLPGQIKFGKKMTYVVSEVTDLSVD